MKQNDIVKLGDLLYADIDKNEYLNEFYNDLLFNYTRQLFCLEHLEKRVINVIDLLGFADVLSKSTNQANYDKHRTWAQEIVALLQKTEPFDPIIDYHLGSILSGIGNHQGLEIKAKDFKSHIKLDEFYSEYSKKLTTIPAEPEKHFFRSQKEVYDSFEKECFSYSGPTSMGKSFVMRMFIKKQVQDGATLNFALIVPTKALINEVFAKIIDDLKDLLEQKNYKVVSSPNAIALKEEHNFIYVLTPERLLYLLIGDTKPKIDYLFIDEANQISTADQRSTFYYQVVEILKVKECPPHFIFSSPNIPNPEEYLKLLNSNIEYSSNRLATKFSPVSQIKFLVNFESKEISFYNSYSKKANVIESLDSDFDLNALISKLGATSQNIIYSNRVPYVIDYAVKFAESLENLGNPALQKLSEDIAKEVHSEYYLAEIIRKGVAYHVGYLPTAMRMRIEKAFVDGHIKTIFCTSTLLEGVNLPADNLFITSYKNGQCVLDPVDFKNLIGRVGRINYNLYGNVFLVRLPNQKRFVDDRYIKMLKKDVPEQHLSAVEILTEKHKEIVIECLLNNDLALSVARNEEKITESMYQTIRKFSIILLSDILKGRNSYIIREFQSVLSEEKKLNIKQKYSEVKPMISDDINISVDQSISLSEAIRNKNLRYPKITYPLINGKRETYVDYIELCAFLENLCSIFKWEKYEKDTLGFVSKTTHQHSKLKWYAVLLSQWIQGNGLQYIVHKALEYKNKNPENAIPDENQYGKFRTYRDDRIDKNIVISMTLSDLEQVVLFSLSNYFLKFSQEYRKHFELAHDWYEYVEYGTTNDFSIMLQRYEFSRETVAYIKENYSQYITVVNGCHKLKKAIAKCDNISVRNEVSKILYNSPELFVD